MQTMKNGLVGHNHLKNGRNKVDIDVVFQSQAEGHAVRGRRELE